MQVKEVMTRDVLSVGPETSVYEVAQLMRDADIGSVLITEGNDVLGVVTDRDIVVRALADHLDPMATPAREVMSEAVFCCTEDTPVEDVLAEMADEQVRRVPVLNGARHLVGVVSLGDLSQAKTGRAGDALRDISQPSI
ncbi:MAG TPA: CBS domain-containing protein [Steroidobacteraceae bacterium]|nr:CBS domain-containing protein [Steroidobacteraceae bacterium]